MPSSTMFTACDEFIGLRGRKSKSLFLKNLLIPDIIQRQYIQYLICHSFICFLYLSVCVCVCVCAYTGYTQKNGAVSKVNKKFISHLTLAQSTPSAAATVQVSHALCYFYTIISNINTAAGELLWFR